MIKKWHIVLSYLAAFVVLVALGFAWINIWVLIILPWIVPGAAVISAGVWIAFLWWRKKLDLSVFKKVVFTSLWTMFGMAMFLAVIFWVLS